MQKLYSHQEMAHMRDQHVTGSFMEVDMARSSENSQEDKYYYHDYEM